MPNPKLSHCHEQEHGCTLASLCDGDILRSRQHLQASNHPSLPLCMATAGETVRLIRISAEGKLRKRLADLGISIGEPIRIMQNKGNGPLILAIKNDTRLGIGRDLARQLWVVTD
ncbi:MAG: ferrous iron transport protein A [Anaerolineales bacterium]|nr:ferrous iron transport protein A [Anaerolineales bacterium]